VTRDRTCVWYRKRTASHCGKPAQKGAEYCPKHLKRKVDWAMRKKYGSERNEPSHFGTGYSKFDR
jgi:hypothetical protein